jgi:hypothetical protein
MPEELAAEPRSGIPAPLRWIAAIAGLVAAGAAIARVAEQRRESAPLPATQQDMFR